jgi:hypothetical protein
MPEQKKHVIAGQLTMQRHKRGFDGRPASLTVAGSSRDLERNCLRQLLCLEDSTTLSYQTNGWMLPIGLQYRSARYRLCTLRNEQAGASSVIGLLVLLRHLRDGRSRTVVHRSKG